MKPTLTDFYIMDDESLNESFTKSQLEELCNDLLWATTELLFRRFNELGINVSRTGGIGNGIGGFKAWVNDTDKKKYERLPSIKDIDKS